MAVDGAGRVWELRGLGRVGAHAASDDNPNQNRHSIGVLFVLGNTEQPTAEQVEAFRDLRAEILDRSPSADHVVGHGQVPGASTACPGAPLRELIADGVLSRDLEEDEMTPEDRAWVDAKFDALADLIERRVGDVVPTPWASEGNPTWYPASALGSMWNIGYAAGKSLARIETALTAVGQKVGAPVDVDEDAIARGLAAVVTPALLSELGDFTQEQVEEAVRRVLGSLDEGGPAQ